MDVERVIEFQKLTYYCTVVSCLGCNGWTISTEIYCLVLHLFSIPLYVLLLHALHILSLLQHPPVGFFSRRPFSDYSNLLRCFRKGESSSPCFSSGFCRRKFIGFKSMRRDCSWFCCWAFRSWIHAWSCCSSIWSNLMCYEAHCRKDLGRGLISSMPIYLQISIATLVSQVW